MGEDAANGVGWYEACRRSDRFQMEWLVTFPHEVNAFGRLLRSGDGDKWTMGDKKSSDIILHAQTHTDPVTGKTA